tara:strand:+ start:7756 stop:8055 length:300 start_codon:yes stop_codon:yes gene_type:complete
VANNYWYAVKGDKCTLQPAGNARWYDPDSFEIVKTPFNVRKINQTAFRIYPSGSRMQVFQVESAKKLYFNPDRYMVDFDRLLKAWRLLFTECPGKKTKF